MWYHWLLVVAGVYMVGSAIYSIISNRSMTNVIMSGVQIAIGAGVGYYGYSSAMAPAVSSFVPTAMAPAVNTMMGGFRKLLRG